MIKKARKRDGRVVDFDPDRIKQALTQSARAAENSDKFDLEEVTREVIDTLESELKKRSDHLEPVPGLEEVQDVIEGVLVRRGYVKTAKAFILYREERRKMRETKKTFLDAQQVVRDYIGKEDWRVNENANVGYSHSGLFLHSAGTIMAYYGLHYVYPPEIGKAHINSDFHIHDLGMSLAGYCAGWSLNQLLREGFNGVPGKTESGPTRHMRTAVGHMVNFIGTLQNEWSGAQAFNSVDTYLAPFVRHDNLDYQGVKQVMQEFVHNMNITTRWGGQTPFSNITLDLTVPEDMKDQPVIIAGQAQKDTYSDYQTEMDIVNKAFIEVMLNGDSRGRVFTWPIPTYNITRDFKWNTEIADLLFKMTSKYGLPYFSNFVNSDLKPSDVRSMCCRLRLELKELTRNVTGGRFGSGENTGSIGVVTINLPRLGYLARSEEVFLERLDSLMYLAMRSLEIKRKVVNRNLDNWLLPYTKRYLGNLDHHFSTIGLVGMHEACKNFLGEGIETRNGQAFAIKILKFMRERITQFQEETGHIYNLESTPAEGTSFRLARKDKEQYPSIITAGGNIPYYTNSTQLPVDYTSDILFALKHQEPLQTLYTGGTVFHTFLGESIDYEQAKILVKKMTHNSKIPYFTLTPTFSLCRDHGYLKGNQESCPVCGKVTEVYSRVVGYLRPIMNWNRGKQKEFEERRLFNVGHTVIPAPVSR
ncbi:MAG: ribonucleoside triphosphate reductase [archaeon]|nr:MAG: ribonucleoside triphosphate reductase [archaeon]